jgi:hypothetical protein
VNQLTNWRGARIASLVPNVLPQAQAAACIEGAGTCFCSSDFTGSSLEGCVGYIYCVDCYGKIVNTGTECQAC